jgi:Xaa-Pro aminopeptidase
MSFKNTFFKNNRKKLAESLSSDYPIVIISNGLVQRNSDIAFPFRQDSSFWYFTGIEIPDLVLVIHKGEEFLIVANRDEKREIFDGSIDIDDLKKVSGINNILTETDGWSKLFDSTDGIVASINIKEPYNQSFGLYLNPAKYAALQRIKNKNVEISDISKEVISLRMVKQNVEIDAIKQAVDISSNIFEEIKSILPSFKNESDINSKINTMFAERNVVAAYESIVASGSNACTLHYTKNNSLIKDNTLLLIDAGAEYGNYASDITRTYSIGITTKRQKEVYEKVVEVQDFAMSILRPGTTIKDYEQKVEDFMGGKLMELGLIDKKDHSLIRKYYPHATSHHLGLDTHDAADYLAVLEENMVLTIEPGIYIPEEGIGVRIEDDVRLVKNNNPDVLSKSLSREL